MSHIGLNSQQGEEQREKGDTHLCPKSERERKTTTDRKGEAEEGEEKNKRW